MQSLSPGGIVAAFSIVAAVAFASVVLALLVLRPFATLWRAQPRHGVIAVGGMVLLAVIGGAVLAGDGAWIRNVIVFLGVPFGVFVAVVCGNRLCGMAPAALVAGLAFVFGSGAALAADGPTVYAIALPKDLVATLLDYVFLALAAGLGWLIRRAAGWLHLSRESLLVERFDHGAEAALAYAREQILLRAGDLGDVRTRSELVRVAGDYLLPKIPGVLKELKIDPAGLYDRLTARLDVVAPHPGADAVAGLPH